MDSILDGSGAFYLSVLGTLAFLALILATGIMIGRSCKRGVRATARKR